VVSLSIINVMNLGESENGELRHFDMGAKIAVVAWQKVLKLDEFDSDRILLFLEAYEGIDHHKRQ